jgi:hypothetical protein
MENGLFTLPPKPEQGGGSADEQISDNAVFFTCQEKKNPGLKQ